MGLWVWLTVCTVAALSQALYRLGEVWCVCGDGRGLGVGPAALAAWTAGRSPACGLSKGLEGSSPRPLRLSSAARTPRLPRGSCHLDCSAAHPPPRFRPPAVTCAATRLPRCAGSVAMVLSQNISVSLSIISLVGESP